MEPSIASKEFIKGDVQLNCGHMLHFDTRPPHKKEDVWCRRCDCDRHVVEVFTGSAYRLKCETCGYTRGREAELKADRGAVSHRMKRGFHHRVVITGPDNRIWKTYEASEDSVNIALPDEPPF